jgi:hypothetical protein
MGETRNACKIGYEGVNLRVPENWGLVDQLSSVRN